MDIKDDFKGKLIVLEQWLHEKINRLGDEPFCSRELEAVRSEAGVKLNDMELVYQEFGIRVRQLVDSTKVEIDEERGGKNE
ncbi:hypothetical protein KJ596_03455 [Patescibacteria group bacterium]|nr:hypothetical protein [Patescibacteria group bacterium]